MRSLYEKPSLYNRVFEDDEEAFPFFQDLIQSHTPVLPRRILSLGCGTGHLEKKLAEEAGTVIGIDLSKAMLSQADATINRCVADMSALPFGKAPLFDGVISKLLSVSYLGKESTIRALFELLATLLKPNGFLLLELPLAYNPRKLQGVSERQDSRSYSSIVEYLDITEESELGAELYFRIAVAQEEEEFEINGTAFVFQPLELRNFLRTLGYSNVRYYAPYELGSECKQPPLEARRGIVSATLTH